MASTTSTQPKRVAQFVYLRPEYLEEYKKCHAAVWPGVLAQIKDSNIIDYSIFYEPSNSVLYASFKYVGSDWDADMKRMAENPTVQEWWQMTDKMQRSPNEGATGSYDASKGAPSWWGGMEEVFRLE